VAVKLGCWSPLKCITDRNWYKMINFAHCGCFVLVWGNSPLFVGHHRESTLVMCGGGLILVIIRGAVQLVNMKHKRTRRKKMSTVTHRNTLQRKTLTENLTRAETSKYHQTPQLPSSKLQHYLVVLFTCKVWVWLAVKSS